MALIPGLFSHTEVTSFADARRALEGAVVRDVSGVMRPGVLPAHYSPLVTARNDMRVNVADFRFVQDREGALFGANEGLAQSPSLPAAPASNKRIDLVYVTQEIPALGDGTSDPIIDFVEGAPSPAPVVPPLPSNRADATPLATVEIPAGATSTQSSGVVITQVYPFTAMAGGTVVVRNSVELAAWSPADGARAYNLADNGEYVRQGGAWVGGVEIAVATVNPTGWSATSSYTPHVVRVGKRREIFGMCTRQATAGTLSHIVSVQPEDRPSSSVMLSATVDSTGTAGQLVALANGNIGVASGYGNIGSGAAKPLAGYWYVD